MQNNVLAKFRCAHTSSIQAINYLILNGNITEGEVKAGQYLNFTTLNGRTILKLKIAGIQALDYVMNRNTKLDIAVECSSKKELEQLYKLEILNKTFFVTNQ
jgi:hypothetical protein